MVTVPKAPFILVDGSSYLFRAYHALPPLMNSKGHPTGAIYGTLNMLRRLMADYQPEHLVVVFDSKEKNFRYQLFQSYKANRSQMPEELALQIEPLFAMIRALGIHLLVVPGVEADDIIGTLAARAQKEGLFTLIATSDKDMAQLVDEQTAMVDTMKNDVIDRQRVFEKFGVYPEQMVDYLSMIGDSVDNIPGIPKVGPKTAAKWLETYQTLDGVLQHADQIKGKVGEYLLQTKPLLPLYQQLVTILRDVDVAFDLEQFKIKARDETVLQEWVKQLEFKSSWLMSGSPARAQNAVQGTVHNVLQNANAVAFHNSVPLTSSAQLEAWFEPFYAAAAQAATVPGAEPPVLCLATTQATGNQALGEITQMGLFYPGATESLVLEGEALHWLAAKLKALVKERLCTLVCANSKPVLLWFTEKTLIEDTSLMSYVLNSVVSKHDIQTLVTKELGIDYPEDKGAQAQCIWLIYERLAKKLVDSGEKLPALYETIELPLCRILAEMEYRGVLVDASLLTAQSQVLGKKIEALEKNVYLLADATFNLNSPQQLQEILFDKLGLPILEKTPTGKPSTAENVLQELAQQYELPGLILEYRTLTKLKSTYLDKLPLQIDAKTGRVHTTYHQAVTATGRLSSSDPNLQNIPIRTEEGRKIRNAFIAPEGSQLLSADYSQIELRIMAHMANDPGLIKAFREGQDIHRSTAAEVFDLPLDAVDNESRRRAKAINFGLIYGMSAFGLSKQLSVGVGEAESFITRYFTRFPNVKAFMETTKRFAAEHGYVETLLGRRLYLPEIQARNMARRRATERAAVNAPLQGTAADIIKKAMIDIDAWIKTTGAPVTLIMQVHDELVFEVKTPFLAEASAKIKQCMEHAVALSVDVVVALGAGSHWGDAH